MLEGEVVPYGQLRRVEQDLEGWRIRRAQPIMRVNRSRPHDSAYRALDIELWFRHPDGTVTKLHMQADTLENLRQALPMLRWAKDADSGIRFDMGRDALDRFDQGWLERIEAGLPRLGS